MACQSHSGEVSGVYVKVAAVTRVKVKLEVKVIVARSVERGPVCRRLVDAGVDAGCHGDSRCHGDRDDVTSGGRRSRDLARTSDVGGVRRVGARFFEPSQDVPTIFSDFSDVSRNFS